MVENMKDSMSMIRNKVKVLCNGMMEDIIKEGFKMEFNMERDCIEI